MPTTRSPISHTPPSGDEPDSGPAELPVEPDLGPVPPLPHPEEPGVVQPAI
jgi:hypothetical protein